jgi:GNAT superfamily N-acetyltransferase
MTAAALLRSNPENGLQPVNLARHLGGVARLIELCFGHELDAGGRGLIRELEWLSRAGPLVHALPLLTLGRQPWNLGYVWVEDGQVIGTVSTQRAEPRSASWLVANVAVHPDHRRRGIALALMRATLDLARAQGGADVILQVDDDNAAAVALYRQMGFDCVTTRRSWSRPGYAESPAYEASPFDIRLRGRGEWSAHLALARAASPEGLSWGKPLREADFRPSLWRLLDHVVTGRFVEHWVAEQGGALAGALTVDTSASDGDRLHLLVHPARRGQLERPLLARGLRRLGRRPWPARLDYAAEDGAAARVLRDLGFQGGRVLQWLRIELH